MLILSLQYNSYGGSDKLWALVIEAAVIGMLFFGAVCLAERIARALAAGVPARTRAAGRGADGRARTSPRNGRAAAAPAVWKTRAAAAVWSSSLVLALWQTQVIHAMLNIQTFQLPLPSQIWTPSGQRGRDLWIGTWYTRGRGRGRAGAGRGPRLPHGGALRAVRRAAAGADAAGRVGQLHPDRRLHAIVSRWLGFDQPTRIVVVAMMTFAPMVISAYKGLTALDNSSLDLMHSYAATPCRLSSSCACRAACPMSSARSKWARPPR